VSVHYEGSLELKSFDSSYPRKPIEFPLDKEIRDEGIALLRVGDKARFVIPSHLG
jgi:peptidyl-prolyl cis-trans isomerase A (cyclophilin A)